MRRDHLSRSEAQNIVDSCREELNEALSYPETTLDDLETIVRDWLDLEPDYLEELLPL